MSFDLDLLRAMLDAADAFQKKRGSGQESRRRLSSRSLQILLWCFETNAQYSDEHARITGHDSQFIELYSYGLISSNRKITDRGQAFVEKLLAVCPPVLIDGLWK